MGIFSTEIKRTDVELAYESQTSTGLCLVLGGKRDFQLSNYDEHKPALRNIMKKYGEKPLPVHVRFDTESKFKNSVGVFLGKILVGWVLKDDAKPLVEFLNADGRRGVGILGEIRLYKGKVIDQVIINVVSVYA